MAFFVNEGIKIVGMVTAIPDNKIPVESFINRFGEEVVQRFSEGTGIHSIYNALPDQTASDLAFAAAEDLLNKENEHWALLQVGFSDVSLNCHLYQISP